MQAILSLMGAVHLRTSDGRDLTPRGQKARGALALLGTAPDLRMNRARLQDQLWSDRSAQQGSDSLRQMLRELRGSLQEKRDLLITGVGWVGLNTELVRIDLTPVYDAGGMPLEFAADIDIPDPEFDDWLRDMRLRLTPEEMHPVQPRDGPDTSRLTEPQRAHYVVWLDPVESNDSHARVIGEMIVNEAAARACDMIPAVLATSPPDPGQSVGSSLNAFCYPLGPDCSLMIIMRDLRTREQYWTRRFTIHHGEMTESIRHAVAQTTVALLDRARRTASTDWTSYPIWDVFSYSRDRLLSADQLIARQEEEAPTGVGMALRSYLRNTLIFERLTDDPETCAEEALSFSSQARALAPNHPVVLAVASLSASWRRDAVAALELAQAALRIDPDSELAWNALSQAYIDVGRDAEALEAAEHGARGALAALGPSSWLMRRAVALVRLGRLGDAENAAAAAYTFSPDNRPSLRFLAALRYNRGDEAGAADALRRLRQIEPDFNLELMAAPDYPAATLRTAGLLGITKSGL